MIRNYFALLLALAFHCSLTAQHIVSGKTVDKENNALSFVNVLLLNEIDSSFITGTISDDSGDFEFLDIAEDDYLLSITFIGFESIYIPLHVAFSIDIGSISLQKEATSLKEVTVTANRTLIQRKIDRLVFNVEHAIQSSAGNALEVLKVTPGIRVQNDQISMIGKSGLAVMIDERIIRLSNEDLAHFLRTIASEDIQSIEVITTPPAKYEASGNSGLINIRLKKVRKNAWNAMIRANHRQRTQATESIGGNFNYQKNKVSIASSLFFRDGVYVQEQDDYAYFPDGLWDTNSPFEADILGLNARLDLNFQLSSNWEMGAQYLFNRTELDITDAPSTSVIPPGEIGLSQTLNSQGSMNLQPSLHAINYNNHLKIGTTGKKLSFNLDYFTYNNPDTKRYEGVSTRFDEFQEQFYAGINSNIQDVKNISGALDIDFPTDWATLSFGAKFTQSKSQNEISFFNSGLVDDRTIDFLINQSYFSYDEDIQALYISFNKSLGEKWEAQLGLRLESTQTHSLSNNLNLSEKNTYTKLFPSFYISHTPNEHASFSFSYSKRISRPQFFDLNPNIYFVNPFQTIEGNPFLQPSFTDNFEFNYTHNNFSSRLYFSQENDLFAQVSLADTTTNIIQFINKNYINTKRLGMTSNYSFEASGGWSANLSFDLNYNLSDFTLSTPQADLKGVNARIFINNNFKLNKSKTWLLNINYWYSPPGVDGIFDIRSMSSLSGSTQFSMFQKKAKFTFGFTDILKSQADRRYATINGVLQEARYYYDSRSIYVSLSYAFGNNDIRAKKHRTGNQEERGRTGN